MRSRWLRMVVVAVVLVLGTGSFVAGPALAADVTFEPPSATTRLGEPVVFRTTLTGTEPPERVELVTTIPGAPAVSVTLASLSDSGGDAFQATVIQEGHATPNTTLRYHFRAVMADGSVVDGPEATATVVDDRFAWRTVEGDIVRLHWYEGDEAFAQRALDIGDQAIAEASELLGVTETDPVDFFIYASEEDFRAALGPGTRENVGGQANAAIRTMFGLVESSEIGSEWDEILVTHELTHLVFAAAVRNPYHEPPRWLNEGLAVFLSEGYGGGDRAVVANAAASGQLIPLEGLGGFFPTRRERFGLAYAESVSAVSYFIDTYGQDDLVALIRSYAGGVTDDEAFTAATGSELTAFDAAWAASVGAELPDPVGPQPAPPGPVPPDWTLASPAPTSGPGASPARPQITPIPGPGALDPEPDPDELDVRERLAKEPWRIVAGGAVILVTIGFALLLLMRRRRGA